MFGTSVWRHGAIYGVVVVLWSMNGFSTGASAYAEEAPEDVGIEVTEPEDGYIDPRENRDRDGNAVGLNEFTVRFSGPVELKVSSFTVDVTGGRPPQIAAVEPLTQDRTSWRVRLDGPIPVGESTQFVFTNGDAFVYTFHPGDVNGDGVVSAQDQIALLEALDSSTDDVSRYDINRDDTVDAEDYETLVSLHERVVGVDQAVCCYFLGMCDYYLLEACPPPTVQIDCPCPGWGSGS